MTKLLVAFHSFTKNLCNNWRYWDRAIITFREILMDMRYSCTVNEAYVQTLMGRNFTSTKTEIPRMPVRTLLVPLGDA
jgi:hypothetical protein